MSVQSVLAHGATGNGTTDDAPAINAAVAAAGPGGTVYFPTGVYRIASTTTTGPVSLRGDGYESIIRVDVGSTSDGVVVTPAPQGATSLDLLAWSDLAILGDAGCCRRGLVIDTVARSTFRNVHVLVGAAQYGIYLRTGWSNHFNFVCSGNMQGVYAAEAGVSTALPTGGHIRGGTGTAVGGLNANVFDCLVEGGAADLLYLEDQSPASGLPAQGNNWITGTYEGSTARGIYAEGCLGLSIQEFHVEHTTGIELRRCQLPTVVSGVTQRLALREVQDAFVDQVGLGQVDVDAASTHTRLGTLMTEDLVGVVNRSPTTVSIGSIRDAHRWTAAGGERVRHTASALANPENLVQNGDFSRWVGGAPEGWTAAGAVARTGTGQADTRRNLGPSAARVTVASVPTPPAPLFWYTLRGLQQQWFTASLYVYLPSGQALTELELVVYYDGGAQVQSSGARVQQVDGWYRVQAAFYGVPNITTYDVVLRGNGAGTFYVADAQAAGGVVSPSHTVTRPANVADVYYLEGHRIGYGTAAPATGSWNQGDVVYARTPAAGGYVGWICTTAGTPGTWKQFGAIAP